MEGEGEDEGDGGDGSQNEDGEFVLSHDIDKIPRLDRQHAGPTIAYSRSHLPARLQGSSRSTLTPVSPTRPWPS